MARDRQRAKQRKARRAGPEPRARVAALASRTAPTCPASSSTPRARSTSSRPRSSRAPGGETDDAAEDVAEDEDARGRRAGVRATPTRTSRARRGARGAGRSPRPRPSAARWPHATPGDAHPARPRALHRLPARVVGRAAARAVARPPPGRARPPPSSSASSSSPALYLGVADCGRQADRRLHPLEPEDCTESMYRWYVVNTYSGHENKVKQNLEHRVVLAEPAARRAPGRRPDRDRAEMKDNQKVSVEKRTMPGYVLVNMDLNEDSWQLVKGTPGRHRLRRRVQRARPADPARGRPPAAPRGRAEGRHQGPVLDRRVGQGHLRPAVGLLRRDLRDQRGRAEAQGAGVNLRPRDPGRGRLRPGEEDLRRMAKKVLTTIKLQAAGGQASPAPPVGPALGQHGINIMEFCKAFNAQTQRATWARRSRS